VIDPITGAVALPVAGAVLAVRSVRRRRQARRALTQRSNRAQAEIRRISAETQDEVRRARQQYPRRPGS
jgi:uncharacterized protein with PIN domain